MSKNYSLVVLVRGLTARPQIIFFDNKACEAYSHEFRDLTLYLKLAKIFKNEFKTYCRSEDWIIFRAPGKYKRGLKYLLLSLRELRKPLIFPEIRPRMDKVVENFEKHRWTQLEREYNAFKLAKALKEGGTRNA